MMGDSKRKEGISMKRLICALLVTALVMGLCPGVLAAEDTIRIHTVEDLLAMASNPSGNYILMEDLDMTGVVWTPVDLVGGSFDGNDHAILNLTVNTPGSTTDISYDGNRKEYDTCFAGFFGVLRDSQVKNLRLINIRAEVEADSPCFLGSIAGAMYDSALTDCFASGVLELRAFDRMFGVGGIAGYGSGSMERCEADMTLVCIDTGVDTLDEQFLGGAFATGFIDVVNCSVKLDAYVSEYGYVHNGGLVGMVMQYPLGNDRKGLLTGNTVAANITFFECNEDRRAYCDSLVGETLAGAYSRKNNIADFQKDERKTYDTILRPEMCEKPVYSESVTSPGCDSFGFTTYTCEGCGYSYTDHYTLTQHIVTTWELTKASTEEECGISIGYCDDCGQEFTREEPRLEPTEPATQPPTTEAPVPETTQPAPSPEEDKPHPALLYIPAAGLLLITALLLPKKKKGKYQN